MRNLLIFQNPYDFFYVFENLKILKDKRNVMNFQYVFVTSFHVYTQEFYGWLN